MKNKKVLFISMMISLLILSMSLTYAYFSVTTTVNGDRNEIKASVGTLSILYTDGPEITAEKIQPGWTTTKTIKVENTGTLQAYYAINWASLTNETTNDELIMSGTCASNKSSCESIASQPVSSNVIKSNISIEPGEEHTYVITFEFIEISSAQDYNQGKKFNGVININESTSPSGGSTAVLPTWVSSCDDGSTNLKCKMIQAEKDNSLDAYPDNVSSPFVTSSSGIDFTKTNDGDWVEPYNSWESYSGVDNSNGKGLYYTTDSTKTENGESVFYYRGAVENNYLIFGGFCWRIIRTTEEGDIKLRYDGVPTEGSCPQTGTQTYISYAEYNKADNDNAYVGYMYGTIGAGSYAATHSNTTDSNIKKVLDAWYIGGTTSALECHSNTTYNDFKNCDFTSLATKLSDYSALIADTPYCNDRSIGAGGTWDYNEYTELGYGTNLTLYGSMGRLFRDGEEWSNANSNPTYKCANNNDKFTLKVANGGTNGFGNNALSYPIGLITADEVVFAGGTGHSFNETYFLDTNKNYYTMTPSFYNTGTADIARIGYDGDLALNTVINGWMNNTVVPVIALKSTAAVSSGNGTYNTPYVIE